MQLNISDVARAAVMVLLGAIPVYFLESTTDLPRGTLSVIAILLILVLSFLNMIGRWDRMDGLYQYLMQVPPLLLDKLSKIDDDGEIYELLLSHARESSENVAKILAENRTAKAEWETQKAELDFLLGAAKQNEAKAKQTAFALESQKAKLSEENEAFKTKYASLESNENALILAYCRSAINRINASGARKTGNEL